MVLCEWCFPFQCRRVSDPLPSGSPSPSMEGGRALLCWLLFVHQRGGGFLQSSCLCCRDFLKVPVVKCLLVWILQRINFSHWMAHQTCGHLAMSWWRCKQGGTGFANAGAVTRTWTGARSRRLASLLHGLRTQAGGQTERKNLLAKRHR